ncbi:malonyl CoA-acyl carrier protein transacylase/2,3-dihydroxybenzoate-AMP ligase,TIGR02275 [Nocardia tenerifensis]|uniref:Malonyl CoA-acyl carrier protein transacylase/2,3-dihydroxybenzoate-AMP ligase,TIGR02275 n=1 Tax=Nocardia tenerifensis TaxID=228006 RepID=A0A318KF30_9NOCA|nr:AMP-binding protein [Nocardia tenerifensis]PXX71555.1 malonyl CoA-acyl carrier protein transacylase/2,3-dihydroxybenzoate-AMP ligase,TIGR02275 [Nocardia tenerifensis]
MNKTAFVFPGQGAQRLGMGVQLAERHPDAARIFDVVSEAAGVDLLSICRDGPEEMLAQTEITQPALLAVGLASYEVTRTAVPAPHFFAGQSLGEYTALAAAGSLTVADAAALVRRRGELMKSATAGRDVGMVAVLGLSFEEVAELCAAAAPLGVCAPALHNSRTQTVVAGDVAALENVASAAESAGAQMKWLPVSSAFHTALLAPIVDEFAALLDETVLYPPSAPIISNTTARPTRDPVELKLRLREQLCHTVQWSKTLDALAAYGVDTIVSMSPGATSKGRPRRAGITRISADALPPERLAEYRAVPSECAARYRAAGFWRDDPIYADIRAHDPDRLAVIDAAEGLTYGELLARAEATAHGLLDLGVAPRDRVLVQLGNTAAFVVAALALWRIRAVPVLLLPTTGRLDVQHVAEASGAVALIAESAPMRRGQGLDVARAVTAGCGAIRRLIVVGAADLAPGEIAFTDLAAGPERALPDHPMGSDLAMLLLSGGTTGRPKLIPRTHQDYRYNIRVSSEICGFGSDTVYLAALPVAHNFALGCPGVLGALTVGGTAVLAPDRYPHTLLDRLMEFDVTATALVPTLATEIAELAAATGVRPKALRLLQVGGARLLPSPARLLLHQFPGTTLQQVYGMAEGLLNFTRLDDRRDVVVFTQGAPASPADELRVVGPDGLPVALGYVGELLTRGPYTIAGYFNGGPSGEAAFDDEGFYRTGDLVRQTPTGYLVVEGRLRDAVNRGGDVISAAAVEDALLRHPAIRQAAVIGVPHESLGETLCAIVSLRDGHSIELRSLRTYLAGEGLGSQQLPEDLVVRAELPVTALGKPDKAVLRRLTTLEPVT